MLESTFVIKNNELCLIGSDVVRGGMREAGMFFRDTRVLSSFELKINTQDCDILSVRQVGDQEIVRNLANPTLPTGDIELRPHGLAIEQRARLDTGLSIDLELTNFTPIPVSVRLDIVVGSDFRDIFAVRGMPSADPAIPQQPDLANPECVRLLTRHDTQLESELAITASPLPHDILGSVRTFEDGIPEAFVSMAYDLSLEPHGLTVLHLNLMPRVAGDQPIPFGSFATNEGFDAKLQVETGDDSFDAFIARCDRDLALLYTSFPDGMMTAAGIPWFISPFGRDSLIVALQTLHAYPERSAATLRTLAALQGTKEDRFREEEPGKILHEMRYGHMARSHQIPHTPYFGSIDSTPLFVMTFAEHMRWYPDDPLYDDLVPNVKRALEWIRRSQESSGDGLLRFGGVAQDFAHISQQGWKDSGDSLHFANGDEVTGPIALVEVQGYAFAAFSWLAGVVERRGDSVWAEELVVLAEDVRTIVEERFWLEDAGFYAQALDGNGTPVDAISSNPGHLLFCGVPTPERAALVAARLCADDMLCPWGVRTLNSSMATYNPMSYHNGSSWPHDSSLAMAGMTRYGHEDLAHGIANRLVATSRFDPDRRLDELYCGFADHPGAGPVRYPVSCRPQAWAAGAGLLAHRILAGIGPGSGSG